ncbi:hypothetical protein DICPUDRAFT_151405 [Dictyostelium purpureum]|uniref:Uncharacterized protein n=1 Tax=Dictyostelium purpureum TaxID=5786 RepID=F0ZIR4_DICPU|nr:uncharacterized protein DICPUDRAFT_151405 [Dictyostelium purpureum]EGC36170.1 hypothetical protein DICPUDRAFT_151405 [Dictyostelium purpureum]|eukprot:XP_003287303.1 hypothetical protein DICPUDRAFT_151405 [Dictyostelium purpureum]
MIFPNYLYDKITKYIIDYLYIYKLKYNDNQLSNYTYNNLEIINLSLVNKQFFEFVSVYIKDVLSFKNYKYLAPLVDNPNSIFNDQNISVKIYHSYLDYKNGLGGAGNTDQYRKILIDCDEEETLELFLSNKTFSNNVFVNVTLSMTNGSEIYQDNLGFQKIEEISNRIQINIILLFIDNNNIQNSQEAFEKIIKLKSKSIIIYNFKEVSKKNGIAPSAHELSNIKNETHQIKVFYVPEIELYDYVRLFNGKAIREENSIMEMNKKDWDTTINMLSSNKTIEHFSLSAFGFDFTSSERKGSILPFSNTKLDLSVVTKDLKTVLTSPNNNIRSLELGLFGQFIKDKLILEGLSENQTIIKLSLFSTPANDIITQVLPKNRTLRNLSITDKTKHIIESIKLLSKTANIDLYSVSFHLYHEENVMQSILSVLHDKKNSFQSIKEINFYFFKINFKNYSYSNSNYFLKDSNTLVNLFCLG